MEWYYYLLVVLVGVFAGFLNTLAGSGSIISLAMLMFMPEARAKELSKSMDQQESVLFTFSTIEEIEYWRVVNDGVMGGLSKSQIVNSDNNTAIFKGVISLENNGGFASTRTAPLEFELGGHIGILLRVKGDGKRSTFGLKVRNLRKPIVLHLESQLNPSTALRI